LQCFFFGGIRGKGVSVKSMILQGSKLHFETPNPRGSGALVYCCNNFFCDGAKSKWLLARKLETPMWQIRELVIWKHAYYIYIARSSTW
jgi:hypothetical protein